MRYFALSYCSQTDSFTSHLKSLDVVFAGGLTTSNGQIIDENGNTVTLKGFALSGLEISLTMSGNLLKGTDSIAHDWDTVMYR